MLTKHFLKTLIIFLGMIIIGLVAVFVSSYLEKGDVKLIDLDKIKVAE